jgi:hypothetical protein
MQGKTYTMVRAAMTIAVLAVETVLNAATISSFQAGAGGWNMGTLAVGDITGDSRLEIVVPYRDEDGLWHLDGFTDQGTRLPGFPYEGLYSPINVSPTLYDLDGDGKAEILFTSGINIVALKGNGSVLWTKPISFLNYVPDAGFQAITNGFYMSNTRQFQPLLPPTAQFFSEVSSPIVTDLAGDGKLEVLTAWKIKASPLSIQDFNPFINDMFGLTEWGQSGETWSGGVIASDARSGDKTLIYHFHQLVESGLAVGVPNDAHARKVYVLNDADSVVAFDRTKAPGLFGKGMLYKQFGKNQRLLSGSYLTGVDVYVADLDGDAQDEVLVPTTQIDPNWQPSETILDDDGAILWRKWKEAISLPTIHGWFNNACMIPINPDHDNHVDVLSFTQSTEIAFRSWNGVNLVDRPGWPKDFAPYLPTPPVVGDIDGDGQEEIIIGTYDPNEKPSNGNLYIFALDGTQKMVLPVPGGLKHIPSIADVNGDGSVDLVYRALDGKVYVQNFGAKPNAKVSWATHRGNMHRDGNVGISLFPGGTPVVTSKVGGFGTAQIGWSVSAGFAPDSFKVLRADDPNGSFLPIATVPASTHSFTDSGLAFGKQYIYEIAAVYSNGTVLSAPVPVLSLLNNNLIANPGFEENDNSHWDKWFTGDIPWDRMIGAPISSGAGAQSMEIQLSNDGQNSTITQYSHYGTPEDYLNVSPGTLYSFGGYIRSGGLTAGSEHWFEWDTAKTGEDTNNRPRLPWPNYFTPSLKVGTEPTDWTYLNRVFVMPPGFPNLELRHRFTVDGDAYASGSVYLDNIFFRPLPSPDDSQWQTLVPFGARWRFSANDVPGNWYSPNFSDGNWQEAPAKFGAGSGPAKIVTALPSNQPHYYFRKQFTLDQSNFKELLLSATCTDDSQGIVYPFRLFLNGSEIASGIDAVSGEGNVVKYFDLTPFASQLHGGINTIAVMLQNTWESDWDNIAFDVKLQGVPSGTLAPSPSAPKFQTAQRLPNGDIALALTGTPGSSWILESNDDLGLSAWKTAQTITFDSQGSAQVTDSGQNNRPPPAWATARVYRLRSQ